MEPIATVTALISILSKCFDIAKKLNQEERDKMCALLKDIGVLLKEVTFDLSNNIYPANKCAQMEVYMQGLETFLDGKVTEAEKQKMVAWITDAVKMEQLLGQLNSLSENERLMHVNGLDTIAGKFSAAARLLELQ